MMRDLFTDYKTDGPALILGKGPTFRPPTIDERSHYITIGLNHVCRETKVDVAHIIDWDVIGQLGDILYENARFLFMPYFPHIGWKPIKEVTLSDICKNHSVISKMASEGRVFGYNLSTAYKYGWKVGDSQMVKAKHYSAEAVVNLLGQLGVKEIRTLGVDGGSQQAPSFSDLTNFNKDRGYDLQWQGIRKSIERFNLNFAPLGVESPIRIFVGAGPAQQIPFLVLKHSILKHATMSTEVISMADWTHPMPKDKRNWPRTPFSFQRFMIPEKCNYKGHAIYMDSDMLVFSDVKEIWQAESSMPVICMRNEDNDKHRAQGSVFKMDCTRVAWWIGQIVNSLDAGTMTYESLVFDQWNKELAEQGWNPDWNSLEEYTEGKTKLLHYTEMYNQPWLRNPDHPLGYLWFNELKEAVNDGSIDKSLVKEHVDKGYILPKCYEVLCDTAQTVSK